MKKITLITMVILTVFIAGCEAPAAIQTPPAETVTATAINATRTTQAALATPTRNIGLDTPVALVTEGPIATPTETDAPTPTASPSNTPTATATNTPEATATPTSTPTITPAPAPQVRAAGKNVNVRRGPGTVFPVMAVLHDGETAPVIARGPNDWLQIDIKGKAGWIYLGVVETVGPVGELAMAENIPTPPPTPTPVPPTATPAPAGPQLPPKQDVVHLTKDTQFPVRANRFIGWGYEIVDASEKWDIVMYRDVFGYVLHQFYGDALYKQHPHGMRVTFLDCVSKTYPGFGTSLCGGTKAPISLFGNNSGLTDEFGDGSGSVVMMGCAASAVNYYDPQECFVALGPVDGGHLTDATIVALILGDKQRLGFYGDMAPDLRNTPFNPYLGNIHRDDQLQQWRIDNPFLKITPQQP